MSKSKWICQNIADNWSPTKGKEVLAALPVFRQNDLSLYCSVPADDLTYIDNQGHRGRPNPTALIRHNFDALVCQKNGKVILAIELASDEVLKKPGTAETRLWTPVGYPIPYLCVSANAMERGDAASIAPWLESALEQAKVRTSRTLELQIRPASPQLMEILEEEEMLTSSRDGAGRVPSVYGRFFGLIWGYAASDGGRARCFCPRRIEGKLRRLQAERSAPRAVWEKTPLAQRLDRLNRGLPSNSAYSLAVAERFANMSLDDYMSEFPAELEQLRRGASKPLETYGQAAVWIYRLLQDEKSREEGKEWMQTLTRPLVKWSRLSK